MFFPINALIYFIMEKSIEMKCRSKYKLQNKAIRRKLRKL